MRQHLSGSACLKAHSFFFLTSCFLFRGLDRCNLGYLAFSSLSGKPPIISLHAGMYC